MAVTTTTTRRPPRYPSWKVRRPNLSDALDHIPGVRVEHKRYAVAVHYRNVSPERVAEIVATTHRHGQRHGLRVTGGRKVVELRPDIDWDKGTALAWIRDHIHQTGRVLPIYVGDDLTDEDAFDAVRFNGIGVVVRHDEDGDRPTAAQFTLNNPDEVREFLRRGGQLAGIRTADLQRSVDPHLRGVRPAQREAPRSAVHGRKRLLRHPGRRAGIEGRSDPLPGHVRRRRVQPSRRRDRRHHDRSTKAW